MTLFEENQAHPCIKSQTFPHSFFSASPLLPTFYMQRLPFLILRTCFSRFGIDVAERTFKHASTQAYRPASGLYKKY
jgi:hypothetical protein